VPWIGILLIVAVVFILSTPIFILEGRNSGLLIGGLTLILTQGVFLIMEFVVEPRFFNRRRYNSLLTVFMVILLADSWGILGLLLGPPLAVAIQVWGEQLLQFRVSSSAPATTTLTVSLEERMNSLNSLLAAMETPPAELTSLVNRLNTIVKEAAGEIGTSTPSTSPEAIMANH
jgi:hypothetical protein